MNADEVGRLLYDMTEDPFSDNYDDAVKRFLNEVGVELPSIDENVFSEEHISMYNKLMSELL